MRSIHRFLFAAAIAAIVSSSATAQNVVNPGGTSGQMGNSGGGQNGSASTTGLPFGSSGAVGVSSQQFQTTSSSQNTNSNVMGSYYANPLYQGRIGQTGGTQPGGFGSALYSSSTSTGGMTGASGNRTGGSSFGSSGSTGRTGSSNSSFGNSSGSGFGSTSGAGGRSGTTGGFGSTGNSGGFGSGTFGGAGGAGGFGGGMGMGGMGGSGMNNQNQNVVAADRHYGTFMNIGSSNLNPPRVSPIAMAAQTELRFTFDNSTYLPTGKSIAFNVSEAGVVHLQGNVASDEEKKLAISLATMTPGVRQVVSELKVQPAP